MGEHLVLSCTVKGLESTPVDVSVDSHLQFSQGVVGTKVDMFTNHIEGQFHFRFVLYLYARLISIFLYVGRVQISRGLLPTRFSLIKFPYENYYCQKGKISDLFFRENHLYVIVNVTRKLQS